MKLKVEASLDKTFLPMSLKVKEFKNIKNGQNIIIGIERNDGLVKTYQTKIYPEDSGHDLDNYLFVSRIVKTLLWIAGGYKIIIAGSSKLAKKIKADYQLGGAREFDYKFMEGVYEKPFEVLDLPLKDAPTDKNLPVKVGRHLEGSRIGFDAGGSDYKISAVKDGKTLYSEEVVWFPKTNSNPNYHFEEITKALKKAASKLEHIDAIGVSTAGVCIANKIMVSSLFMKVPDEDKSKVHGIYLEAAKKLSQDLGYEIPIEVANDGDVTALAGAMDMNKTGILGIAMGTSEAGGYIDNQGNITGYLNELAFVPVDYSKEAMIDEWSGDYGCGVKYFSQDAVIKLAPFAGISLDSKLTLAEQLKVVQELMQKDDPRALKIYETIGVYFGYGLAYYAEFYDIKEVLIMGRVTSSKGGVVILEKAKEVLEKEFPLLAKKMNLHIPDEHNRRVGQSVAAASLPEI